MMVGVAQYREMMAELGPSDVIMRRVPQGLDRALTCVIIATWAKTEPSMIRRVDHMNYLMDIKEVLGDNAVAAVSSRLSNVPWRRRVELRSSFWMAVMGDVFFPYAIGAMTIPLLAFSITPLDFLLNAMAFMFVATMDNMPEKQTYQVMPARDGTAGDAESGGGGRANNADVLNPSFGF